MFAPARFLRFACALLGAGGLLLVLPCPGAERPNILWLTSEDNGPQLGCYGDGYATTPHLDALARRSLRYTRAWSNAPVCAPARTALISGRHPTSDGSEHMRSQVPLPAGAKMYPQLLREAGYYCTNNAKEDYNLEKPEGVWDRSGREAHYRNRAPGQPFFAVFNSTLSHESQVRAPGHVPVHDPAQAPLPAYHPDTPEVRKDWAQYYDKLTEMDAQVGRWLRELEEAGLADSTIIFYYGDHGAGLPRSKRWPYHSGLHVPLIVHFPEKYRHLAPEGYEPGGSTDRLVSFVDLGPTVVSLAGVKPPAFFQGRAFAGPHAAPAPAFLHGYRGRMDERLDLVRSVTDGRHVYLRHYLPHLPYGQHIDYMFQMPTARVWRDLAAAGRLASPAQRHFWEPKPTEELYDLTQDRWEVRNLAADPAYAATLATLRTAAAAHAAEIRDLGFIPEAERLATAAGRSPRDAFLTDAVYPFAQVYELAARASDLAQPDAAPMVAALGSENAMVRYWGVTGLRIRGPQAVGAAAAALRERLRDASPSVRIAAAAALTLHGPEAAFAPAMEVLLQEADPTHTSQAAAMEALNAVDQLGPRAAPYAAKLAALPRQADGTPQRLREYVTRLHERISSNLQAGG